MFKKSLLTLLLMALFAPFAANAQSVTLGSGTSTSSYLPVYNYYNYSISQQIYTADEINASGNITSIAFYNAGAEKARVLEIYMAHTTQSAFASTSDWIDVPETAMVYSSHEEEMTFAVNEWTTFTLDTPFAYNGTDNLVVVVIDRTGDYSYSPHMACRTYSTTEYQALYLYNDNYNQLAPNGTNGDNAVTATGRPQFKNQIVLGGIQQAYPTPTDLAFTHVTATSADFTWSDSGTPDHYEFAYKAASDADFTTVSVNTTAYTLENLTPNTSYSAKVRAYYNATVQTPWTSEVSFLTMEICPDGMACIGSGTSTNSYIPTYAYYNYSLTQQIYTAEEIGATGFIQSIQFHASASVTRNLDIYMVSTDKSSFTGASDWIAVTATDQVFSGNVTFAAGDWTTIELTNYFNYDGTSNLAIIVDDNTGSWESSPSFYAFSATSQAIRVYNDDTNYDPAAPSSYSGAVLSQKNRIRMAIGEPPTCFKPMNLTVSNIGKRSADLSWTPNTQGEERNWQICLNGDESNLILVDETSYTLTLQPFTDYTVKVRAYCDEDDQSEWTDEVSFTTLEACPAPTVAVSDVTPFGATVAWEGDANSFNLRYGVFEGAYYDFETAEAWTSTNFAPCTTYDGDGLATYSFSSWEFENQNYIGACIAFQSQAEGSVMTAHSGNAFGAMFNPQSSTVAADDWFIMPEVTIKNGDVFSFWGKEINSTYGPELVGVGIYGSTDGTFATVFEELEVASTEWEQYSYDLSAYAGQTIRVALHCHSTDVFGFLFDDLVVGNPDNNTWENTYANATSPFTLEDLEAETQYVVGVQSVCGEPDGSSAWTYAFFTTPSNCAAPFNLNATNVIANAATLEWEGYQDSYNVQYRTAGGIKVYHADDFDASSTIDSWWTEYTYGGLVYFTEGDNLAIVGYYSDEPQYLITGELPDNMEEGTVVEFDYRLYNYETEYESIDFKVGYSTTTADHTAFTWEDFQSTTTSWTAFSEAIPEGTKYIAIQCTGSEGEEYALMINNFSIHGGSEQEPGEWITIEEVTSPYDIYDLDAGQEYEFQVQGNNRACDEEVTEWSASAYFETPGACDLPSELAAEVTTNSATLTWTGAQEVYNVQYREAGFDGYYLNETWDGEIDAWGVYNLQSGGGIMSYGVDNSNCFGFYYTTNTPQYLISPDLRSGAAGNTLTFEYRAYSTSYPETFALGWETGAEEMIWEDEITTEDGDNTWHTYETVVPEGAQYFVIECSSYDQFYLLLDNFVIYGGEGDAYPAGEWITASLDNVTSPVELTDLTPDTYYDWQVQGVSRACGEEGVTDWVTGHFHTLQQTDVTQVIELYEGWNWVSTYIDMNEVNGLAMLEEALGDYGVTIATFGDAAEYLGEGLWLGLEDYELTNSEMVMIEVVEDCTITLEGPAVDPLTVEIPIDYEWNWIGFPFAEEMNVEDVMADYEATDGDGIGSFDGYIDYLGEWMGEDFETLVPGQGYMYYSENEDPQTLVFSTGAKAKRAANTLGFTRTQLDKQVKHVSGTKGSKENTVVKNGTLRLKDTQRMDTKKMAK